MNSQLKFNFKKKYGQHFLNNEDVAKNIIKFLEFKTYKQVIEVGPGTGVLTKHIVKKCKPVLIEIDKEAIEFLNKNIPNIQKIVSGNFLKINLKEYLKKPTLVIGNFPYNISTQILFKILKHKDDIVTIVGMFQKEVAERICSKPNSKKYGIISVLIQAYYNCGIILNVTSKNFTPPPKVESSVVEFKRNMTKKLNCNEEFFFKVVKLSFNQRRKKIKNSLKLFSFQEDRNIIELLEKRAEQLNVSDFINLTNKII
jgi:16S rRNA (adenine1518-N6/adenine1519-N6)-dimethyltransferase